jgi:tetratricopeptide (TPR) repeat protein
VAVLFPYSLAFAQMDDDEIAEVGDQYLLESNSKGFTALCKAIYWENMRNYSEVKRQLNIAVKHDADSSFLHAKLAETLFNLKEIVESAKECRIALKLNPNNANAHYLFGLLNFIRSDRYGRQIAISEFKKATELNPEHLAAQYRLAGLLFEDEDYEGAAVAYSEMVRLRPYDPKLRYQLGISYSKIGKITEATMELNAAIRLSRNYLEPHFHLAFLYASQSKNEEAIEESMIVLEKSPGEPNINLLLAEIYVSMDEFDRAIARSKTVLKNPNLDKNILAEAYYRLAAAYKGKGENELADLYFKNSIEMYEDILNKDNSNAGIHYDLAMVYDAKGDLRRAEHHLRRHIELDPNEPNAHNFLGYAFVEHNMNLEEALALIQKAVELQPENGAFRDSLGWAYFKLGNLERAIDELEKAAELIPNDSEIREHLGEVYLKKGGDFIEKAIVEWEKALEIRPKNISLRQKLLELRRSLQDAEELSKDN